VISRGGIDEWFSTHTDDEIHEYLEGLFDPFADLSPPNLAESQTNKSYYCVKGTTTTRANVGKKSTTTYTYWKGADYNTAVQTSYNKQKNPASTESSESYTIVSNATVAGTVYTTTVTWTAVNGSSVNTIWEKAETVTATTYSNISKASTPDLASPTPGTYVGGIKAYCATNFTKGVYVIDGGGLEIDGQYPVAGSGVMFILKNGAYIKINGGSNINLTAMEASDLIERGVAADDANKLAGMLVFEDHSSEGSNNNNINGNASTVLNGTIYMPNSGMDFSGTATVTSRCLMIASLTITLSGSANMSSFCPPGMNQNEVVANEVSNVKLVV
jgi:hypothetical protein